MKRIAIQGIKGSFHDMAAHQYFKDENLEMLYCSTFDSLFATLEEDNATIGVMAIENTIAGTLLHNYELLRDSGCTIIGEYKLHIEHSLMCLPEDSIEDIKEVNSHPLALAQCRNFLATHPSFKAVVAEDTAGAAAIISQKKLRGHAAICHEGAAPLYGMKVLKRAIEDNKHNFTRFLILSTPHNATQVRNVEQTNKSSLVFSLSHEEGSLAKALSVFSSFHINLTKIQSLPIIGKEWEYLFYVDLTYGNYARYRQSINTIKPLTKELTILGEYLEYKNKPQLT